MYNETDNEKKYHVGYFAATFFLVFIISFLVLFFLEKEVRIAKIEELHSQEQRVVRLETDFLGREFGMVLSDLHYLHHAYENELSNSNNYEMISKNWAEFSSQRGIYDQIRYIEANGDEKIRINKSKSGGYIVDEEKLQNKKDRYYFTETIKLKEEGVYISPLDLNIERGEIEIPYKPMIRLSTPIYDNSGYLKGIIVLNYLADNSLSRFRELARSSQGEIVLLNANGYTLSSNNPDNDWNFMFDDRKNETFKKQYPDEWESIIQKEGQFVTEKGLFTALSVDLNNKFGNDSASVDSQNHVLGDGNWYVLSIFERSKENGIYFDDDEVSLVVDVLKKNIFYFVIMIIISAIVGFLVYANRKTYSRIKYYSEYDSLTKALNRRAGIDKLNELFMINDRRSVVFSLCFIDINGLKEVNDTLGHKLGDELITTVSKVIKQAIREQDFLVRLGGDEFLIVFNGIGMDMAENIWGRIVENYNKINNDEDRPYFISVSHGIVDCNNKQKTHVDDLINAADEKMYQEKLVIKSGLSFIKK